MEPYLYFKFQPTLKAFSANSFCQTECFSRLQLMLFLFRFSSFPFPTCYSFCSIVSIFVSSTPYHVLAYVLLFHSWFHLPILRFQLLFLLLTAAFLSSFLSSHLYKYWCQLGGSVEVFLYPNSFCALFFCLMVFFPFLRFFLPISCCGVDGCYVKFTFEIIFVGVLNLLLCLYLFLYLSLNGSPYCKAHTWMEWWPLN